MQYFLLPKKNTSSYSSINGKTQPALFYGMIPKNHGSLTDLLMISFPYFRILRAGINSIIAAFSFFGENRIDLNPPNL